MLQHRSASFELPQFIAACQGALREDRPERAMREVAARALAEPAAVLRALGAPERAGIQRLYHAADLTILNVVWAPHMSVTPHDHRMWAVIGIYEGREDNVFWRRIDGDARGRVEAAGARALATGDAVSLGRDLVHSVLNPISRLTGAIHIYGGDFFAQQRSEWDPETLLEQPYDVQKTLRVFEEANARVVRASPQ